MLMATEPKGNLEQVYEATTPAEIVRKQQSYPFKGWYSVVVRAGREQEAADGFRHENVLAYWPNQAEQILVRNHLHGGHRRRVVFRPIIPGYLFSPIADIDLFWFAIQRIPAVVNIVRVTGGAPGVVTNIEIDRIRKIETEQNDPPEVKVPHRHKTGDKVRFAGDIHQDLLPGKIERLLQNGRIRVETPLLGRLVPFDVWPHQIEAM
jgi:transcription antitermination factor NusG